MYQLNKNPSPYHTKQDNFLESPEEQVPEGLDKYLNVPITENYTDKLKKQIILVQIQTINGDLSNFSKERFGDLTLGSDKNQSQWYEIQKTIKLVKTLISCIYRDSDLKKQLNTKLRKNQEEISRQAGINEKISKQKRAVEKQKQTLDLKIKCIQRQFKQDIQKIKRQKDQAEKKFQQIWNKQNQYKNEIRKNQQTIAQLQQKIKNKGSIDKTQIKNKFEKIEEVKNYGPSLILSNSQNEFNKFYLNNAESNFRTIIEENQYLKKCLQSVYQQLHSLLQVKKEIIKKRKGFESALDSEAFQLQNIRPETFNLPKDFSQDSMQKLGENLSKFKQALKLNDLVNDKVQDQKIKCVSNVKNLINNYKQIVENQDKLINRVVLKSKQYKSTQMAQMQNKYNKSLEEDDLQRSKKFLQEQRQILLQRNKQLELTRKAMRNTIKKAEEQKKMFNKKRIQTNQQLQMLKKNIEKLPAMVQEQLSSMI